MKPFAREFYSSITWQKCRNAYMEKVGGLCEECLKEGRYTPAEIVHHIEPLNANNINNPAVSLNFENLYAVCRLCHAKLHGSNRSRRYHVDEVGHVIIDE